MKILAYYIHKRDLKKERSFYIMNQTITKKDLVALGYGTSFSIEIIRQAKQVMVDKGFAFYESRKLDRVPLNAVEEILGITFVDGAFSS